MALEREIFPHKEPTDPVIQTNLDVVTGHFCDEATNNIDGVLASYTDDIRWYAHIRGIVVKGKDDARTNYDLIFSALRDIEFDTKARFATSEYVFDYSKVRFTVAGEHFSGLPVGQKGELNLFHIFRMRGGKICEEQVYEMLPKTVYEEIWKPSASQ